MDAADRRRRAGHSGVLAIEVTARCHRRCAYCYQPPAGEDAAPAVELPIATWVGLVEDALAFTGRRVVQISGGEPMLRSDLFELVDALRAPGRGVSLVTDGGLIGENAARALKKLGVAPVQPTLLAARREVHDELKGAESFDATVGAIARLLRAGVPVSVSFVCTRRNHEHFREVVELCFALGVRTVAFSRFCTAGVGATRRDELTPDPDMIAACLDVAEEANARLGMRVSVAISLPLCLPDRSRYPNLSFGHCAAASDAPGYTIDPRGRLRACSVSPVVLGDLLTETWGDVLARAHEGYFREVGALPPACSGCELARGCGGGCRESVRGAFGDLGRADPVARV